MIWVKDFEDTGNCEYKREGAKQMWMGGRGVETDFEDTQNWCGLAEDEVDLTCTTNWKEIIEMRMRDCLFVLSGWGFYERKQQMKLSEKETEK